MRLSNRLIGGKQRQTLRKREDPWYVTESFSNGINDEYQNLILPCGLYARYSGQPLRQKKTAVMHYNISILFLVNGFAEVKNLAKPKAKDIIWDHNENNWEKYVLTLTDE